MRDRADLVAVVAERVELRKVGRELVGLCPFHAERTPSFTVNPEKRVYHCHGCGAGGDVFDFLARSTGRPFLDVARELARQLGVDVPGAGEAAGPRQAPAVERPAPRPPDPPRRPPADEVAALWALSRPVTADAEAAAWLRGRALDPALVEAADLARALPAEARTLPRWCWGPGGRWPATGHRLLVPLYGAGGRMESLRARDVTGRAERKALAPARAELAGLVLADTLGCALLAGRLDGAAWDGRLVIAEGEPDWLTWATRYGDAAERVPATFGIIEGSWTPELAARVPAGATVIIRTDHDRAGDAYAEAVRATLATRCAVKRSPRPTAEG